MELQITAKKDFIEVYGEIISYNGNLQMNIKQLPCSRRGRIRSGGLYADQREKVWMECMKN